MGIIIVTVFGTNFPANSQEIAREPLEVRLTPAKQSGGGQQSCLAGLPKEIENLRTANPNLTEEQKKSLEERLSLQSKRLELYHYRNAANIANLLSQIPFESPGCVTTLPLIELQAGLGVGRGGGNVLSLYGTKSYIQDAQRFITSLDLPLPGIDLQLWGVQISSKDSERLAKTTARVRSHISTTQELLRRTFATIQGISQRTLQGNDIDPGFREIATQLGYGDAVDGLGGESSILELFLVGNAVSKGERLDFYQTLYDRVLETLKQTSSQSQDSPYLSVSNEDGTGRPPFERILRSRGLQPVLKCDDTGTIDEETTNKQITKDNNLSKCDKWKLIELPPVRDLNGKPVSLLEITANFERKVLLEFALHYSNFLENPQRYDPGELQRTADKLNELLQQSSDLLQKDIEDLFLKPTLAMIQKEVGKDKKVEFAQVGRTTISTLDGVQTAISTSSTSGFEITQSQNLSQLLERAEALQGQISNFLPTSALGNASETAEVAATGGIPVSRLLGLAVATLEQNVTPIEIETGTSLAFTPGISRNLNSAELNIDLTVTDPQIEPTAEGDKVPPISRIGKQELQTTVYTQALDFFDLSTFTSQATLGNRRFPIPVIGTIWNAVFGSIPVFGELFSLPQKNQNVLHESLILTNSFITPTPLSLGTLYSPISNGKEYDFCQNRRYFLKYTNEDLGISGKASSRETEIIREHCSPDN